ncbi:hypothetical protein J0X19_12240 [Hymenobacter sp. BT186]|uniref:Tetratricopeptide repeat protein n=1 Tax=Hymenobacter telluris TaxID=2816474 RepID=A0A939J9E3_9BACT|nr:hypothetical protein [Hymenobacter telluris]MBO0358719.1 hypothetical protein [Hymenobacter telluris]MBW3374745.1 hypothetical protein [Hymenobacter norwichensis]
MPIPSTSRAAWRNPLLLTLLLIAGGAILLAIYQYFTGDDATLPVQVVSHLKPVPTVLTTVRVGLAELPIRVNSYLLTQTHDMVGPYVQPEAAWVLLGLLASMLVVFLAVVSTLERPAFVAGMAGVIFLLMSLNADLLGVFKVQEQYFLILALVLLGGTAYVFHAFRTEASLGQRLLGFAVLVAGLSALLVFRSTFSPDETALHLTSFATLSGAAIAGLLVLWVGFENIQGLLWFNTQAENPNSRFGLLPFVASSVLYLGTLAMYLWNGSQLLILPGVSFDPLVLLLPAVGIGWLGLQRRAASYRDVLPYWSAAHLYLVFVTLAAGFLGYAFATANDPLLLAARQFTALTLLISGAAFLLYVLVNFGPLIRQRLRVYRVVYEPRRLPLYAVYVLTIAGLAALEFRYSYETLHQLQAGYYNNLADLTRLQSEITPNGDALALLAERYYAESDILDEHNHKASLGRAALYRYHLQRQNEINILRRALSRRPSEKISLRLAALYNEPADFFDRLATLREGLKNQPASARLNNDLAQLYTRSTLTDSVAVYLNRAEAAAASNPVVKVNQLAFLLQTKQFGEAQQLVEKQKQLADAAWQSNVLVLTQFKPDARALAPSFVPDTTSSLTVPEFARFYHAALRKVQQPDTSLLPAITKLIQQPDNSSYFEQLTFLKALTQHYGGRPVPAYATLAPLTAGATPSAAYYLNVRGLWQLRQRTYLAAAATLHDAARNGYPEARLNRAYALALNQQLDSARTVTASIIQDADTALVRPARQLQRVLTLKFPDDFRTASDSVQAQFYVLRGQEDFGPASMNGYSWYGNFIEKMRLPVAHDVALVAQAQRAVRFRTPDVASVLQAHPLRAKNAALASERNVVYGQALLASRTPASLQKLATLLDSAIFLPLDQPNRLYLKAALAASRKQSKQATQLYQQLVREAPFLEPGLLAAAEFYTSQKEYLTAYSTLQAALEYNPESIALLKAYTLASVPAGLTEYAANSLEKLRVLLSPAEYATFRTIYLAHRTTQDSVVAPWN